MKEYLPEFDELYVMSDLHIGGQGVVQVLRETKRLANLIHWIKNRKDKGEIALVLNGDVIDSLAEPSLQKGEYAFLHARLAEQMLQRIFSDPEFEDIWKALAEFVQTDHRHLIFVIGNHDIEVALPLVQASITKKLTCENPDSALRLSFMATGCGFACLVSGARVFCTHGNEVDDWNEVDYNRLSQVANALNAGRSIIAEEWEPNAGTKMVIDAINDIKRDYPFVDLLKPETNPIFGVLLTLAPRMVLQRLDRIGPILEKKIRGARKRRRLLSGSVTMSPADETIPSPTPSVEHLLGQNLLKTLEKSSATSKEDENELILSLLQDIDKQIRASDAAETAVIEGELSFLKSAKGWMGLVYRRLKGVRKEEALRCSLLDWLKGDETFSPISENDDTFHRIMDRVGPDVNFVVTGHSHLARAIEVQAGQRYYFNCGTWMRLVRLTTEVLESPDAFESLYKDLSDRKGKLKALDKARIPGPDGSELPLVVDRTNLVRIAKTDAGVVGELFRVRGGGISDADIERRQELKDFLLPVSASTDDAELTPRFVCKP